MKILLVDDNKAHRDLLRIRLQAEGHATCEAGDGVEALAQLERQPVDAVVSDVLMPRMDGFRLCHTLRKNERFGDLPFILCSGAYTGETDAKLAQDLGADHYLSKPCPMTTLLHSIRQAASRKRKPGAVEAPPPASPEPGSAPDHDCPFGGALAAKLDADQQRDAQAQEQLRQTERRVRQSAIRMIVTLALSIFFAECTAMFALLHLPSLPYWLATVLDAIWIELLVSPLLFYFVFRPLVRALVQREQAEVALRQANEDLEFRVQERTTRLEVANTRLHKEIAERKQAERTWRQLAEAMTNLVWTCTADGACDFLSKQWLEYTGRTEAEQLGDGWLDQIHPNDLALVRGSWQRALQTAGELDLECRIRRHDGVYRWFKARAVPVRDARDQIFKWYGSGTDIHDLRETEAALRESEERRKAEQQVRELNEQLAQRVKDLAAANDELEAFSYSVSHDLRAPLRQAAGFVDILRGTSSDQISPRVAEYLGLIRDAMKRMGSLIEDLLAFSRVGRVELRWNEINLADLVSEVRQTLEPLAEERTVIWKIGNLPQARGDASMLRQVLTNLLENALKFTRTRPQAEIEIGCTTETGEHTFYVRDNGVGFNPEYAGRLFGVFQRLHRAAEFEGTGIGLANVRRIIHRHGGRTWAESVEGQGATFYFSLPRR